MFLGHCVVLGTNMATYAKPSRIFDRALGAHVDMIWTGRAARSLRFRLLGLFLVPFSAVWFGLVLAAVLSSSSSRHANAAPWFFLVPFVCIGFYIFAGRFLVDIYLRSQTFYALSARDATSYGMARSPDGSGTISFGTQPGLNYNAQIWGGGSLSEFVGIPKVAEVYALIAQRTRTA